MKRFALLALAMAIVAAPLALCATVTTAEDASAVSQEFGLTPEYTGYGDKNDYSDARENAFAKARQYHAEFRVLKDPLACGWNHEMKKYYYTIKIETPPYENDFPF